MKLVFLTMLTTATLLGGCLNATSNNLSTIAASSTPVAQKSNLGTEYWQLRQATLDGKPLTIHTPISLHIQDGTVSGNSGVNQYHAQANLQNGTLTIKDIVTTRMAGSIDNMRLESNYLSALRKVQNVKRDGNHLILSGEGTELHYQVSTPDTIPPAH